MFLIQICGDSNTGNSKKDRTQTDKRNHNHGQTRLGHIYTGG